MTIATRAGKGSALSHNEMDTNFTDLRDGVGGLKLPKTSGLGIKVDSTGTPTFPCRDLIGDITPKVSGPDEYWYEAKSTGLLDVRGQHGI